MRSANLAALSALAVLSLGSILPAHAQFQGTQMRVCRDDEIFIDRPVSRGTAAAPIANLELMRLTVEAAANDRFCTWFGSGFVGPQSPIVCSPNEPNCVPPPACPEWTPNTRVTAVVSSVFDADFAGAPSDAVHRFKRLTFVDTQGARLALEPDAMADVVTLVRKSLKLGTGPYAAGATSHPSLYVGRECDAGAQGSETLFSEAEKTSHLVRMEVANPGSGVPGLGAHRVNVALIDGDVDPAVAEGLGVRVVRAPEYTPAFTDGRHGALVALAVRQVAPDADLHVYPVLDAQNGASAGQVARAVMAALEDAELERDVPLVVNLSLGLAPESSEFYRLRGRCHRLSKKGVVSWVPCETYEDPAGEPLRYALALANDMDRLGDREVVSNAAIRATLGFVPSASTIPHLKGPGRRTGPISVFASAGNRTAAPSDALRDLAATRSAALLNACGVPSRDPDDQLYTRPFAPAVWGVWPTCRNRPASGPVGSTTLVHLVGGLDGQDRPAFISRLGAFTPLSAPATQVYLDAGDDWPSLPARTPEPVCAPEFPANPATLELPAARSGTSIASAFAAGLAARAHATRRTLDIEETVFPRLTHARLGRLLHASAALLCRDTFAPSITDEFKYRRLSAGRLDALMGCAVDDPASAGVELETCLSTGSDDLVVGTFPDASCNAVATRCDLGPEQPQCDGVGDFAEARADVPSCAPDEEVPPGGPGATFECDAAGRCPIDAQGLESLALGTFGPQPPDDPCPTCLLALTGGRALRVQGVVNRSLTGRVFTGMVIKLTESKVGARQRAFELTMPLTQTVGGATVPIWVAGASVKVATPAVPADFQWPPVSAQLTGTFTYLPLGRTAPVTVVDTSVLTISTRP
jgi:hypothetical protein